MTGVVSGFSRTAGTSVVSNFTSTDTIDLTTFENELQQLAAAIAVAPAGDLPALRARVPAAWVVRTSHGQVTAPADWITIAIDDAIKAPEAWPATRATLASRLKAMLEEVSDADSAAAPDVARARTSLTEILARREFAAGRRSAWMGSLRNRISEWLQRLFSRLGGDRLGRRGIAIVLAWLAVLAALAVLVSWLVRGLVRSTRGASLHLTAPFARRKSARAWALEAAAAADPREAARCGYHAALQRLEEEGAWQIDDTRTPREYLRLLPQAHARRSILSDITGRFEQIWYGARQATADDASAVIARLKDLGCLRAE